MFRLDSNTDAEKVRHMVGKISCLVLQLTGHVMVKLCKYRKKWV